MTMPPPAQGSSPNDFMPPIGLKDLEKATVDAIERMEPYLEEAWDKHMENFLGFLTDLPGELQFEFYHSREPWFILQPGERPFDTPRLMPSPWLAELVAISLRETRKHIQRYKELLHERGFDTTQVLDDLEV